MTWHDILMTVGGCLFATVIRWRGLWTGFRATVELTKEVEQLRRTVRARSEAERERQRSTYRRAATWQTEHDRRLARDGGKPLTYRDK